MRFNRKKSIVYSHVYNTISFKNTDNYKKRNQAEKENMWFFNDRFHLI